MENIVAIMSTLKKPFSSTSIIYDEENGNKPFIVPVFMNNNIQKIMTVSEHGVEVSPRIEELYKETRWILCIMGFFEYAAYIQMDDILTAIDSVYSDATNKSETNNINYQEKIDSLISQCVLCHLNTKEYVRIDNSAYDIDIFSYENDSKIINELRSVDICADLIKHINIVESFGPTYIYNQCAKILELKFRDISFFREFSPIPNNSIII